MSLKRFESEDLVLSTETVTTPLWTDNVKNLTSFFTGSQKNDISGNYYLSIYNDTASLDTSEEQFYISHAHIEGSGSNDYNSSVVGKSPSRTNYGQYRSLILGDEESQISFGGYKSDYFFAINVDRNRYKEKLLPGTLNLTIKNGTDELELTDNSGEDTALVFNDAGRVYQIVSGSNGTAQSGNGYSSQYGSYGLFLPDVGIILLNGEALDDTPANGGISLGSNTSSNVTNNYENASILYDAIKSGNNFELRAEESITSQYVFVRARNGEFNYSTNPSSIDDSGDLIHTSMIQSPESYITTVGIYNDTNDLLAVAKLSKPIKKNFTKEALLRIKLDY